MDLIDHLQTLAARAKQAGPSLTNEEATKMALIAPFIQALGYDIFNPVEVKPEFSADLPGIKQGERVDYAILEDGHPKILVEAKPYTTDLKTAEMGQLSRYFQATNARIGILTNGQSFLFYSDFIPVDRLCSERQRIACETRELLRQSEPFLFRLARGQ